MNISTGLYRLSQAIKWVGRLIGGLWLGGVLYGIHQKGFDEFVVVVGLAALLFIATTEVVAWVLKGFAED